MTTDIGGIPMVQTGGYGCGEGFGGGWMGLILILALFGGCGFGGFGRGCNDSRGGCGDGYANGGYAFGLQRDILENRYVSEKNTAAIITSQDKNTCAILEKMSANELREAYAKIGELNTALSEQRITGTILANLQPPRPIPSYPVANPYMSYQGCGFPQHGCC